MKIPKSLALWTATTMFAAGWGGQATAPQRENPLADLVGRWQSDTVAGTSIAYDCELAPGPALVCEEALTRRNTVERWLGVYVPDSQPHRYAYYEIAGGRTASPAPVTMDAHVWVFGGTTRGADGTFRRSVHDYTARNGTFIGLKESSADGVHWTVERRSVVRRKRPLVQPDVE